jgi:hypothetical protein
MSTERERVEAAVREALAFAAYEGDTFAERVEKRRVVHADVLALILRERAAAFEAAAKVARATVCDVHLPTGVRIYGNKAADAIRALAAAEREPGTPQEPRP